MRHWRVFILLCLWGMLAAATASFAAEDEAQIQKKKKQPDSWNTFESKRPAMLAELASSAGLCIGHKDTDAEIFRGCIDWHSSVHGHWALLRVCRATGDTALCEKAKASIATGSIKKEIAYLKEHPQFEMPYGRAWFLLLATEYKAALQSDHLAAMATYVAGSLKEYYGEVVPRPGVREYKNDSWALTRLFDYYRTVGDKAGMAFVKTMVEKYMLAPNAEITPAKDMVQWPDFFSPWGNWMHLLHTVASKDQAKAWLASYSIDDAALQPVADLRNAHHFGMDYSRAWGFFSAWKVSGDIRYRDAAAHNIIAMYGEHARLKNNYRAYGQWVSQFGVYAITSTMDEFSSSQK